jgi:hypothetical protein
MCCADMTYTTALLVTTPVFYPILYRCNPECVYAVVV